MDVTQLTMDSTHSIIGNPCTLTRRRDTYDFIDPFRFRGKLSGQLVLIANANRGIGRATALDFAATGATVVCTARSTENLIPILSEIRERYNLPAYALAADFSDSAVPKRLVQNVEQSLGPIDILVNITGYIGLASFALEEDFLGDWWETLELNLRAPIALIHAVLPSMIARGRGTIITTTLGTGITTVPFQTADSATRAAMIRFHHGLDYEVRPKGIFSYIVNPGIIASLQTEVRNSNKSSHFAAEPRMQAEMTNHLAGIVEGEGGWSAAGLASGTFVALCAEPRARCLSGLFVNASRDIEEVIQEIEKGEGNMVETRKLYMLRLDEL